MPPLADADETLRVESVGAAHLPGLHALFEAASSQCYCRYWHFTGTKNEWLDRCANRPAENAAELDSAVRAAAKAAPPDHRGGLGLVALAGPSLVGWMKLTPRAAVPKLRRLPVYRSLDLGDDAGVVSIGCFLIHPEARGRGVARALVAAAPAFARAWGAHVIEAYPRRSSEPLHPEEAWQGPERLFVEAGFKRIPAVTDSPDSGGAGEDAGAGAGFAAYPVYRRGLDVLP